jgi:hypothetical protein
MPAGLGVRKTPTDWRCRMGRASTTQQASVSCRCRGQACANAITLSDLLLLLVLFWALNICYACQGMLRDLTE